MLRRFQQCVPSCVVQLCRLWPCGLLLWAGTVVVCSAVVPGFADDERVGSAESDARPIGSAWEDSRNPVVTASASCSGRTFADTC
jgi:hypothetical protein